MYVDRRSTMTNNSAQSARMKSHVPLQLTTSHDAEGISSRTEDDINTRQGRRRQQQRRHEDASGYAYDAIRKMSSSSFPSLSPSSTQTECFVPTSGVHDPSSHDYYDRIYSHLKSTSFATSDRVKSVEVVPPQAFPHTTTDEEMVLLHIMGLTGFSAKQRQDGEVSLLPRGAEGRQGYGDSNGLLLGVHHFNNGIGSVVSEVEGINKTCPIRLVNTNYDSESSQAVAVNLLSRTIVEDPGRITGVLFGAWRSAVSVPLATLSGVYGIPQISPLSTSTELDDFVQYHLFSRLIPSDAGTARAAVSYFRSRLDLKFLGVIYVNDAYGSAFNQAMQESAIDGEEGDHIKIKGYPFSYNANVVLDTSEAELAIKQLSETGYRVFFGVFYSEHYELIMNLAYKYGIVGPEYLWIISDGLSETYFKNRKYEVGSPLAVASQGIGILKAEGGRETPDGSTGFDRFVKAFFSQDGDAVGYTNCKQPKNNTLGDLSVYYTAEPDFFQSRSLYPTAGGAFAYDTAIGLGLAACRLYEEKGTEYFVGSDLFDAFVNTEFEGATGKIEIDPKTTSRMAESAFFVLYNSNGLVDDDDDGLISFQVDTVSHTAVNADKESFDVSWVDIPGRSYRYGDGSTTPPLTIPPKEGDDKNQIGSGLRGAAYALMCLILVASIGYTLWTYRYRNIRIVRASQPMFLYMICVGTFIMGITIIPVSIDDGIASQTGCDIACMMTPWLLTYGFVISFSALFSKTWRINRIFHHPQMRRIKVTTKDVIIPFFVLLGLNTIVLIAWTVISPLKWERVYKDVQDDYGRPLLSVGRCTVEDDKYVPYVVLLFIINLAVLVLANVQAYQARTITTEYSESKYIGIINASILQASIIGVPLLVIVSDEAAAFFFVRVGLIFVVCMSILLLIFIPKMKHLKEYQKERSRRSNLKEQRKKAREVALKMASNKALDTGSSNMNHEGKKNLTINVTRTVPKAFSALEFDDDPCDEDENKQPEDNANCSPMISKEELKECYEKVLGEDADLDVDEELAIINAASKPAFTKQDSVHRKAMKNVPDQNMENIPMAMISSVSRTIAQTTYATDGSTQYIDDGSCDDSLSVSSGSFSLNGSQGIKIINHPRMDISEVKRLRAQVEYMKLERLETSDKMRALRFVLASKGIDMDSLLSSLDKDSSEEGSSKQPDSSEIPIMRMSKAFANVKNSVRNGIGSAMESDKKIASEKKVRFGYRPGFRNIQSTHNMTTANVSTQNNNENNIMREENENISTEGQSNNGNTQKMNDAENDDFVESGR